MVRVRVRVRFRVRFRFRVRVRVNLRKVVKVSSAGSTATSVKFSNCLDTCRLKRPMLAPRSRSRSR